MTYEPAWVKAQVLYADAFYDNITTLAVAGGSEIGGFESVNAFDWRDFSIWIPVVGMTYTVQVSALTPLDTIAIWREEATPSALTLSFHWSADGVAWNLIGTYVSNDPVEWIEFTQFDLAAARYLRITCNAGVGCRVRAVSIGKRLQFPVGQWKGIAPPALYHGVVVENAVAVNGSILGRNLRRFEKRGEIDLNLITEDWVRTYWNPFVKAASRHAFWYRWNPSSYPSDVAFAVAKEIPTPTNDRPGRMAVNMPIQLIGCNQVL